MVARPVITRQSITLVEEAGTSRTTGNAVSGNAVTSQPEPPPQSTSTPVTHCVQDAKIINHLIFQAYDDYFLNIFWFQSK